MRLEDIHKDQLPAPLKSLAPAAQAAYLKGQAAKRDALNKDIAQAAAARAEYLQEKVAAAGGSRDSLDAKLFTTLRAQAKRVGAMELDKEGPAY